MFSDIFGDKHVLPGLSFKSGYFNSRLRPIVEELTKPGATVLLIGAPGVGKMRLAENAVSLLEGEFGLEIETFRLGYPAYQTLTLPQIFTTEFPDLIEQIASMRRGERIDFQQKNKLLDQMLQIVKSRAGGKEPLFIAPRIDNYPPFVEQLFSALTKNRNIRTIATTESLTGTADRLSRGPYATVIPISPLTRDEAQDLLCQMFNTEKIDAKTLDYWLKITGGNTYLLSAMGLAAKAKGILRVNKGIAWVPTSAEIYPTEIEEYLLRSCTPEEREVIEILSLAEQIFEQSLLSELDSGSVDSLFERGVLTSVKNVSGRYSLALTNPLVAATVKRLIPPMRLLELHQKIVQTLSKKFDSEANHVPPEQLMRVVSIATQVGIDLPLPWLNKAIGMIAGGQSPDVELSICKAIIKHPKVSLKLKMKQMYLGYRLARILGDAETVYELVRQAKENLNSVSLDSSESQFLELILVEEQWLGGESSKRVLETYDNMLNRFAANDELSYFRISSSRISALLGMGLLRESLKEAQTLRLNLKQMFTNKQELHQIIESLLLFYEGKFRTGMLEIDKTLRHSKIGITPGKEHAMILEFLRLFGCWAAGGGQCTKEDLENLLDSLHPTSYVETRYSGLEDVINMLFHISEGNWPLAVCLGERVSEDFQTNDSYGARAFAYSAYSLSLAVLGEEEESKRMLEKSLVTTRGISEALAGFHKLLQLQTLVWLGEPEAVKSAKDLIHWAAIHSYSFIELRAIHLLAWVRGTISESEFDRAVLVVRDCDLNVSEVIINHLRVILQQSSSADLSSGRVSGSASQTIRSLTEYGIWLPMHSSEGLTSREKEVATLAGYGYTNKEISEKLHISVRTVGSHLGNIYTKLDIDNRRALSEWIKKASAFN